MTLQEHAEKMLNQIYETENYCGYPQSNRFPDGSGVWRQVFIFKHEGRKYVLKVDKTTSATSSEMGCKLTAERWIKYCQTDFGAMLCPIFAHGNFHGLYWVVQPVRRTWQSMFKSWATCYSNRKINNALKKFRDAAPFHDIKYDNMGMTNQGVWQIIDY